jgi:hypothetical protein
MGQLEPQSSASVASVIDHRRETSFLVSSANTLLVYDFLLEVEASQKHAMIVNAPQTNLYAAQSVGSVFRLMRGTSIKVCFAILNASNSGDASRSVNFWPVDRVIFCLSVSSV